MAIVKYGPLSELRSMQDKMNRLLDLAWTRELGEEMREGVWQPPADIYEDDEAVTIELELPDLGQEDIDIRFDGGVLTIKGERRHDEEIKKDSFHRIERYYGPFQRSFSFAVDVDGDKLSATCANGVLTVTLPKNGGKGKGR